MNSAIVTVIGVVCTIFSFLLAAYAVSRVKFFGANFWFGCIIMTMMIPAQVMGRSAVHYPEKAPPQRYAAGHDPAVGIRRCVLRLLIVQYMRGIPKELDEAAMIDGCSKIGILFKFWSPLFSRYRFGGHLRVLLDLAGLLPAADFCRQPEEFTIVLIHGADDYCLSTVPTSSRTPFLLDLIARCWRDGTVDAVQQSIAYTVAYYGLLHRSDVAQCLTDYATVYRALSAPMKTTAWVTSSITTYPGC